MGWLSYTAYGLAGFPVSLMRRMGATATKVRGLCCVVQRRAFFLHVPMHVVCGGCAVQVDKDEKDAVELDRRLRVNRSPSRHCSNCAHVTRAYCIDPPLALPIPYRENQNYLTSRYDLSLRDWKPEDRKKYNDLRKEERYERHVAGSPSRASALLHCATSRLQGAPFPARQQRARDVTRRRE